MSFPFSICFDDLVLFSSLGLKKKDDWEKFERYDQRMRQQYFDPIEGFPNKVEQLFEVLEQVIIESIFSDRVSRILF